jgi:glycosyltransferase involved in cell wall biosynthesis
MVAKLDILLATYNGARYLAAQLDSLMNQTELSFRILISDDGSSDETLSIITSYEQQYPGRFKRLPQGPGRGACANFDYLLRSTDASHVFLVDQDDVWDCDKVAIFHSAMQRLECQYGSDTPILIHGDLRVVDSDLTLISPSFFKLQHLDSCRNSFKSLLCQNVVTGCTVMLNRALIEKSVPVPLRAMMHDWWLALVVAAFGRMAFVEKATMSYRQHGKNTVGARGWHVGFLLERGGQLISRRRAAALLSPSFRQAAAFLAAYGDQLPPRELRDLSDFVRMRDLDGWRRLCLALCQGYRKHGLLRTAGFYWALLIADFNGEMRGDCTAHSRAS